MPHDTKKGKLALAALRHSEVEKKRESGKGLASGIHEGSQAGRGKAGKASRGGPGKKHVLSAAQKKGTVNPVTQRKREEARRLAARTER